MYGGWAVGERRPMDRFTPSESFAPLNPLESGVDDLTRTTLLKLLLFEAEKSCASRQQFGQNRSPHGGTQTTNLPATRIG
jgi:hypothetical protein